MNVRNPTQLDGNHLTSGNEAAIPHFYRWKLAVENLGHASFQDLRIHDLRRTLGSWQAADGASLSIIGKTLGHKNVSTTAIYARLNLDPVRQSVNAATKAMLAAGGVERQGSEDDERTRDPP